MTRRDEIVARGLFEVFPDNPNEPWADGTTKLRASLARVVKDGEVDAMAVQRYPVRRPAEEGGEFEERYWSPVNAPVFGPNRELLYIVHRVEDVTELVQLQRREEAHDRLAAELWSRAQKAEAEASLRVSEHRERSDRSIVNARIGAS